MTRNGYDMPTGTIIGDFETSATLNRYDTGAQQGPTFYGDTDQDVIEQARAWYKENNFRADGSQIWPDGLQLRIR